MTASIEDGSVVLVETERISAGLILVDAINADASHTYWVARLDADDDAIHGCGCASCAPHEQSGPVPALWTCGHATSGGQPCRRRVRSPYAVCYRHMRS